MQCPKFTFVNVTTHLIRKSLAYRKAVKLTVVDIDFSKFFLFEILTNIASGIF